MSPRTGRPTDNPKGKPIHVRLDANSEAILDKYTQEKNVSKSFGPPWKERPKLFYTTPQGDVKSIITSPGVKIKEN